MKTFDNLFILGLPACGKSEFIDYIKQLVDDERAQKFHIGRFDEIDDFPWLWRQFEDDDIWEKVTGKRPNGSLPGESGYINTKEQFDFMIAKFDAEINRRYLKREGFYNDNTLLIEFSRGGISPYAKALPGFRPEIYKSAAIFYIEVTVPESRRRNEARYQEKLRHSILAHRVPSRVMELFYGGDDWAQVTDRRRDGLLDLNGVKVPFITMNNEPELKPGPEIAERYKRALDRLWEIYLFEKGKL